MADADDLNDASRIIDRIDDSVVADSDSPKILLGHQFSARMRTRRGGQMPKRPDNSIPRDLIKRSDVLLCGPRDDNRIRLVAIH